MEYQKIMDITNEQNHFMLHNNMRLTQLWKDHAMVELGVRPASKNLFGGIHGGVLLTLADCAAGAASRSNGHRYVTLSSSFEFFAASESESLFAIGSVRHRGKTICVVSVDVKDAENKLLASGHFTMFAIGALAE